MDRRSPPHSGSITTIGTKRWQFDKHRVHQFIVQGDNPANSAVIAAQIDKLTANSFDETRTQTENAALQSRLKQFADINFIANSIVGAVMFTLLFLVANTMMQSVRERIPELAVLKTFGIHRRQGFHTRPHRISHALPVRRRCGINPFCGRNQDRGGCSGSVPRCCPLWSFSGW